MHAYCGKDNFWEGNKLHLYGYGLQKAINDCTGHVQLFIIHWVT